MSEEETKENPQSEQSEEKASGEDYDFILEQNRAMQLVIEQLEQQNKVLSESAKKYATPIPAKRALRTPAGLTDYVENLNRPTELKFEKKGRSRRISRKFNLPDYLDSSNSSDRDILDDENLPGKVTDDSDTSGNERLKNKRTSLKENRTKENRDDKLYNRVSMLENIAKEQRNQVQIMQYQPRYDHIKLESLTLKSIFRFMDDVYEYQNRFGVNLPVPALLSRKVRDQIIAHHPKSINVITFYSLGTEKLFKYLLREVRPNSKLAFIECLEKYVDFEIPHSYKPDAINFKPFYNALLIYRSSFERVLEAISTRNEENIPDIKYKEGGLIKVFVDKIKFSYGKRVFQVLEKEKFASMEEFLNRFYERVEVDFKISKLALDANSHFGGAEPQSATLHNQSSKPRASRSKRYPTRLNAVGSLESDGAESADCSSGDDELPRKKVLFDENCSDESVGESGDVGNDVRKESDNALMSDSNVDDEEQMVLQQIQELSFVPASNKNENNFGKNSNNKYLNQNININKKSEVPNGCFQMLFFGSCSKSASGAKCSYSHDYNVLTRSHAYYSKLLSNSKYKPNGPKKAPGSISHIGEISFDDVPPDKLSSSLSLICTPDAMQNMFLNALPEASLFSASHRAGYIVLASNVAIPIHKALFDSGALHANYISQMFVDKHKKYLKQLLKPCSGCVKLADNKTVADIKHVIVLPVSFLDGENKEHSAVLEFCVFDTSGNDIIIGLPSIIQHFSCLFKHMIDRAVSLYVNPISILTRKKKHTLAALSKIYPWSSPIAEDAPEDVATELPSSFPDALHYMEMSTEEALKEYYDLIPSHVAEEFRNGTKIEELLRTKGANVFVPQNWNGINRLEPLELKWRDGMPLSLKPRARPVNPKLYQHAKKEFERLSKYFYVPSDSPIASCLVIAPKATYPFIRFCGDYVKVNTYIITGHYPIPHVQHSLEKIIRYKIFLDFDMANSFHQIPLGQNTSEKLSVVTPWGQVRPLFLPEGVPPASGVLQSVVSDIFGDFADWSIAIFDNLLVLAHDYEDAYRKVEIILDRCIERNVFLKFSKSWLGFDHAKFFGYICKLGYYELSQDRKDAIKAVAFPRNMKQMQSFLGAALFFKSFLPHYSSLVAPLNDMIKKDFNWDESTWTQDYRKAFDQVKDALQDATAIFYPNFELEWILRTDASQRGVGAVLLQVYVSPDDSSTQYQPIGFASQKFSEQASRWTTIEQEAYGIYFGVKSFAYYLICKPFILETDHNNLLWIEASAVPKVIRWRVYLQSFSFLLRHIPGKHNLVADWLSRADTIIENQSNFPPLSSLDHVLLQLSQRFLVSQNGLKNFANSHSLFILSSPVDSQVDSGEVTDLVVDSNFSENCNKNVYMDPTDVLRQVHGGRMGHFGARKTWNLLNQHFPGHRIPYRFVEEFVMTCPVCQKDRLGMVDSIKPLILTLKPEHRRSMVGVDTLTITPPDEAGNSYLTVVVNHFTKLTGLYPSAEHSAIAAATALFQYFCTYGLIDCIISDPGSEFMNEVVSHLTKWLGIRHQFSLVGRHESNGVERTNASILRHLKALVFDERIQHRWSHPTVLPLIQFILNSQVNSESGVVPFHAHFGSHDATYFKLPAEEEGDRMLLTQQYIKLLDDNLNLLHEISKKHQESIAAKRQKDSSVELQNVFQTGDLILWQHDPDNPLPSKLSPKFVGPYEVIEQKKNDVHCRHVILGHVKVFHVSRVKLFHGSMEEAKRVAQIDNNQYVIREIVAYRGNPEIRTTMEFEVLFEDGSLVWKPWDKELFDTIPYETFCRSRPELLPLIYDLKIAQQIIKQIKQSPITAVKPGDTVLVDLRCYGATWYQSLPLPDKDHSTFLLSYRYTKWKSPRHLKIEALCPIFNEVFTVDNYFVVTYGSWFEDIWQKSGRKTCLIDEEFVKKYPEVLPSNAQLQLIHRL